MVQGFNINNYDCKNAFEKVQKTHYLEDFVKANKSLESAKLLFKNQDFDGAFIMLYRSLEFKGNGFLVKKLGFRSKSKNCQFKALFEASLIDEKLLEVVSELAERRNNVYYRNNTIDSDIDEEEYLVLEKEFLVIFNKLEGGEKNDN